MSIVNHNVVKAHSFARQAEEAIESRQWEEAIQLFQQAADLFLLATNDTSDLESIKALQLLSNAQSNKAKALLRHLQHFNTRNAETATAHASHDRNAASTEPMEEISLSASENFFVGQPGAPTANDKRLDKQLEKRSVGTEIWGWMERMLELLVLPEPFKASAPSQYAQPVGVGRDSSLMSSFYFVPAKEEEGRAEVKELDNKVQSLEASMVRLAEENAELKKKLQQANAERAQASKENDVMKRSIMQFRQEFNKKAHLFRDISSSVGHLPSVQPPVDEDNQLQRNVQQLRLEVMQLQNLVSHLTQKSNRQHQLIEKYEEELQKYQRRPGQFAHENLSSSPPDANDITSSQILSSSDNPAPFEPDESLTSSTILQ